MYGILISAFNATLGWVFRVALIKAVIFTILYVVVSGLVSYLMNKSIIPTQDGAQSLANIVPASAAYMFSVFKIWTGISMILTAYAARFMIRRIPFIG